jgi:hypothetical protein
MKAHARLSTAALVVAIALTALPGAADAAKKPRLNISAPDSVAVLQLFRAKLTGRASADNDVLEAWLDSAKCAADAKHESHHAYTDTGGSAVNILHKVVDKGHFEKKSSKTGADSPGPQHVCAYLSHKNGPGTLDLDTYKHKSKTVVVKSQAAR